MYAIVRNKDGSHYTSAVFGYFCRITAADDYQRYLEGIHNQFYVVLNEAKDSLIKKHIFPSDNKYLDPQVLIVEADQQDWTFEDDTHGCVDFLRCVDFYADELAIDPVLLGQCITMDAMHRYNECVEIKTEKDIENLMWVSGGFHDAYVEKHEQIDGTVYVLFAGVWGCKIEMWFEGEAAYSVASRDPEEDDPTWYCSSLLIHDGFFYLVDEENMKAEDIDNTYCWFRSRRVKYHVIPNT